MPDKPRTRKIPKFVYNSNGLIVEFEFGKRWEIWRIIGALLKVWLWSFVTDKEEFSDAG